MASPIARLRQSGILDVHHGNLQLSERFLAHLSLYRHAGRNCKWAAAGFVAGLAILLVSFASSLILGAIGFLIMLGSAFVFERNLRKMGRASWHEMTEAMRARGGPFGDTGKKLRERFKRDD